MEVGLFFIHTISLELRRGDIFFIGLGYPGHRYKEGRKNKCVDMAKALLCLHVVKNHGIGWE